MAKARKFGTFGGVFTPSILTILGVIMYMRLPMIVGEAGLFGALGIIFVAHLISITTGLSVSSIATDKRVKEGGTYYIISRSLGLSIGGTLGLALFVGLSFSVSLYLIGFSESFLGYFGMPFDINHIRIAGSIILLLVTIITFISTSLAIKTQYLIMTAIVLSLLSIFFGHHSLAPVSPNFVGFSTGVPLMVLFGIFFPAVTGFEAGVSMSGDLKDPKKSIPLGTISAIAIGLVVYIGLIFFLSYTVDGKMLATDPQALFKISLVPQLVIAGIWGATLSSALGSILAAPRILQSTALDKITPRFFAHGTGASKEPRNALLLTFVIAEAGILIGQLDVIARIVSIFFITTYGFLNLSAAFESLTSADFRPSFRTPAWVSIVGSLACFLVMIQLDFLAMVGAVLILGTLFLILKRRQLVLETGDAWSSVWSTLVRTGLRRLNRSTLHARNWRPNIILFSGQDTARPHLVELAKAFCGKLGMYSAFELVESNEKNLTRDNRFFTASNKKEDLLIHQHLCRDIYEGMNDISRVYGFSGIEPNTILMGWSRSEKNREKFLRTIKNFEASDYNTIFLSYNSEKKYGKKKSIDVWWSGWGSNFSFSIFLMRHFTVDGDWKDAQIRVLVVNGMQDKAEGLYKSLQHILNRYRINLEIKIIDNSVGGMPLQEIIAKESSNTDLTVIGIPDKRYTKLEQTYDEVVALSKHLGTFILINSSSQFESFNLGLEDKAGEDTMVPLPQMADMPELQLSNYTAISEAIGKMDIDGQVVLKQFYDKTFVPVFSEMEKFSTELQAAIESVFQQLYTIEGFDDAYRRRKTLIKIKNDFYFRINRIYGSLTKEKLVLQQEALGSGLTWYIDRLDQDLRLVPAKMVIPYERRDLSIHSTDSFRLRWFKLHRRFAHPFSGAIIPVKVRYRDIADYYLCKGRHRFLSVYLSQLQLDILKSYSEGRSLVMMVDTFFESLYGKVKQKEDLLTLLKAETFKIQDSVSVSKHNLATFKNKVFYDLMVELRSSLVSMSNDMEAVDINFRIGYMGLRKSDREELLSKITAFPETWYQQTLYQVNKIYLDMTMQSFRGRIVDKVNDFNLIVVKQLDQQFLVELGEVKLKFESYRGKQSELASFRLGVRTFEERISLIREFERFGDEVLRYTTTLPASLTIAASSGTGVEVSDDDHVTIPLSKITRFYIESRFLGSTHDQLDAVIISLREAFHVAQDTISLGHFNLENIPDDLPDRDGIMKDFAADAIKKIALEQSKIKQAGDHISQLLSEGLREVFDQLSAYKIAQTTQEYSRIIREHQGKRAKRRIDESLERVRTFFKHFTARLLYSRSEGILLAKKMLEVEPQNLANQKIIDLVERVSPREKVLATLPQFYKNLFSGNSLISEDFWIPRIEDEALFQTAVRRHRAGYGGGILVVGDANIGKSAFCRYVAEKSGKKERIIHLQPPYSGSVQLSDFELALQKATGMGGSIKEIMESLSPGTMLIIHDLELWWERSLNGWEVVRLLMQLINTYGQQSIFVVNVNPLAFGLMNRLEQLQDSFIATIPLRPFNSMELQELVLRRHRSSAMKFMLNKREENKITEIRLASLFNRYFDYSEGNPGTTLKAWLVNITKVAGKQLTIEVPHLPDTLFLAQMEEEWKVILIQLLLHKRMSSERVARLIYSGNMEHTDRILQAMKRSGLVESLKDDVYMVNQYLQPHLVGAFRREGLL